MIIHEVSERVGLSEYTLRYYENLGLLGPIRKDEGGRRDYSDADIVWLQFIGRLKSTGMPLRSILKYAKLREQGDGTIPERYRLLEEHDRALEERIEKLLDSKRKLNEKMLFYRKRMESARLA